MNHITFRYAKEEDVSLVFSFVMKLAEYEGMPEAIKATEDSLREELFRQKRAEVLFVLVDEKEVGFSLFFENFAAYTGHGGIFIDDLYVDPEYRGKGIGKALIQEMAKITLERGGVRLEWLCLKENTSSMEFYKHIGGKTVDECVTFRVTGEALLEMINK